MALPDSTGSQKTFQELVEAHEKSGYLKKTDNGFGWQMNVLDEFGEEFVNYAKSCTKPILDLGVAYGYSSKRLLENGATVIANELSEEMLSQLPNSVTPEQHKRLQLKPGNALDLDFPNNSFDGIMANRMVQFLQPGEFRMMMERWAKWLAPGGKLCVTGPSVYFLGAASYYDKYLSKKKEGHEWPGYMEKPEEGDEQVVSGQSSIHWFDLDTLEREAKRAGLHLEKVAYVPRPYGGTNGKEGVGMIANKPKL